MNSEDEKVEDFLAHYGVKGMKWGVRRSSNSRSKAEQKRFAKDNKIKTDRQKAQANRRLLDDKDLDAYITRLEKEKKLKKLVDEDTKPGKTWAKNMMSDKGTQVVSTIVVATATYAVRAALQKKFDAKEMAEYFKPKKK